MEEAVGFGGTFPIGPTMAEWVGGGQEHPSLAQGTDRCICDAGGTLVVKIWSGRESLPGGILGPDRGQVDALSGLRAARRKQQSKGVKAP